MKSPSILFAAVVVLVGCDPSSTGLTPVDAPATYTDVAGKRDKVTVCHVGNEEGPDGARYDPSCVPGEDNGYFCPDAGRIDLIEVAVPANHLGNPAHAYDGISDYEPLSAGASGVGKEDTDGDGIDEGCEIPVVTACPCWATWELDFIDESNVSPDACDGYNSTSASAVALFTDGLLQIGFMADPWAVGEGPVCGTIGESEIRRSVSPAEAEFCVAEIEARCEAIAGGGPTLTSGGAGSRRRN